MGAVKSHPGLNEPDKLATRYGGVPVVYVESEEDNYVYGECWFKDRLSKLEFKAAAVKCATDGCDAVLDAVNMERRAGNPAWGIVDRDIVMGKERWDLVHETNDEAFERAKPFGNEIKVLCRWEMESYLADGEALEHIQAGLNMKPKRALPEVFQELLDHCHVLVPHATINAVLHLHKLAGAGDGYTNRFSTAEEVADDIRKIYIPKLPPHGQDEYENHLSLVAAFDSPGATAKERLNGLLRRVHGKALLKRFFHVHHKIQADVKGLLANRIKEKSRIPEEIEAFVDKVACSH
ncbi:MAG: hypothetical protein AB1545_12105 [Thermodesulfobacteriota bacterium]